VRGHSGGSQTLRVMRWWAVISDVSMLMIMCGMSTYTTSC
jgi:hypothetical protein